MQFSLREPYAVELEKGRKKQVRVLLKVNNRLRRSANDARQRLLGIVEFYKLVKALLPVFRAKRGESVVFVEKIEGGKRGPFLQEPSERKPKAEVRLYLVVLSVH
jgi:hypothetical protein